MSEKFLLIDIDRCIRCFACEVACKQEHDLNPRQGRCKIVSIGPRTVQSEICLDFVPVFCLQCENPVCELVCPTGAVIRREDGIVSIDQDKCKGCMFCYYACPSGSILFDHDQKAVSKCDLCADRIDSGLNPSCVQHCVGGALAFVDKTEYLNITQGMHTVRVGKVVYASSKWALKLDAFA